ncbi:hypothetical protein MFIFM68171_00977 [Madurella fahalii]|uniref:Uncharacterized protein n=1 Tax=Madurella fahalii TaxID=1157608 RepID=A0ABQ0FZ31_9PEZI
MAATDLACSPNLSRIQQIAVLALAAMRSSCQTLDLEAGGPASVLPAAPTYQSEDPPAEEPETSACHVPAANADKANRGIAKGRKQTERAYELQATGVERHRACLQCRRRRREVERRS